MKKSGLLGVISALVFLTAINASAAPVDHVFVSNELVDKLNLDGSLDMNFLLPNTNTCRALAVDGNSGNVWLGCWSDASVRLFTSGGVLLNTQMTFGIDEQACVDPYGNAWFTDRPNGLVRKFNSSGTYINGYNVGGTAPSAIACDRLGNVWTANSSSNNITKLNNSGGLIGTFPVSNNPRGITIDAQNNIWVATNAGYVDKFDNNGNLIGHYGAGNVFGYGIAIDQNGNVWIVQSFFDNIVKLSPSGNILGTFACGSGAQDVSIDASGNIWVVNRSASTVTKLSNIGTNLGTFPLSGNSGQNDTGFLHQRFVLGFNSVEGPNVWVPLSGGAPAGAVTLTFDSISSKGNSSYTQSGSGTPPPVVYILGTVPRYYNITTTAISSGNIQVCIGYNESELSNEPLIRLLHTEAGNMIDVTTLLDTTNNIVCGTVTSLGEFAVAMDVSDGGTPTVSTWVLILMAGLLLSVMVWRLRRNPAF